MIIFLSTMLLRTTTDRIISIVPSVCFVGGVSIVFCLLPLSLFLSFFIPPELILFKLHINVTFIVSSVCLLMETKLDTDY